MGKGNEIMGRKIYSTIFVALLMTVFLGSPNHIFAQSNASVDEKLRELEKEHGEIKEKNRKLEDEQGSTEGKIDSNVNEQNKVEKEINTIDEKLMTTRKNVSELENSIVDTNNEVTNLNNRVEELKDEIKQLQERIKKRDLLLKDRLQSIQRSGGPIQYLGVILGSANFGDFISRSSAVNKIMDQDKLIMEEQAADKLALEGKRAEIETKRVEVEERKVALEEQKQDLVVLEKRLDEQIAEKESLMATLEIEYEELEEYKLSLEEEQQILNAQEATLEKAKQLAEDEKKRLAQLAREKKQSSGGGGTTQVSGNGIFIRPAAGGSGPNSGFGWRIHPISGKKKHHNGLDIQAGHGSAVSAAGSGIVASAGWMGGYGKTITITHQINGKTYTTLYAHLSQINVSSGQEVKQGQQIGNVGNTGNSTGPHLHFEVHPGGYNNPDNPEKYF